MTPSNPTQAKLVKQEQQAIDAQYEKKRKGAEVAQKMCVHWLQRHAFELGGFVQHHHDLAHERRQRRVEQGHRAHGS